MQRKYWDKKIEIIYYKFKEDIMNKYLKKITGIILIVLLTMGTFAGCTGASENGSDEIEAVEQGSNKVDEKKHVITINTQAGVGVEEAWKAVGAAYTQIHPNVEVVVDLKPTEGYGEWVQNIFTTQNPSTDIININLAGSAAIGRSINFMEYADSISPYSEMPWTEQFNYSMQVRDLARGEWTALSLDSVQVIWLYNKEIFEEVGVDAPETWEDLIKACEQIYEAGYQPISIPGDFNSFWSEKMGWLAQIYADQTTRSMINEFRAQEGDYCYDPDVDGVWEYNPTDPYNDDNWKVNYNAVRAFKTVKDGIYAPDSIGMKTVWENFGKVFPKYAGEDAFFGTKDGIPLFYQGKAAMTVDGAWRLVHFQKDMERVSSGEEIKSTDNQIIEGIKKFELGTFNMPSMEGEGIEAPARTIEVANGFLGAIKKDKEHDALVVDFLMYLSSKEGQTIYLNAGVEADMVPNGPSLVYGVELPSEIASSYEDLEFIGNAQKGYSQMLARGMAGSQGDIQESYRAFYDYSYDYLNGNLTIDEWLNAHKKNIETYLPEAMKTSGISESDLENPQSAPTGQ